MLYIFDLGGVVVQNYDPIGAIARRLGLTDTDDFVRRYRDPFDRLCTGVDSAQQFWDTINHDLGTSITEDLWTTEYRAHTDPCVVRIVEDLKRGGARVVAGTNTLDGHYRYHEERGDLAIFDAVYASHIMGLLKPDPAFYRYILEAESVTPSDAFFVDDRADNVESARGLGIEAVQFTSCATLRRILRSRIGADTVSETHR